MNRITVPDIGGFENVLVIDVFVAVGNEIAKDQTVALLETDKAVMESPSSDAGVVTAIDVKIGDRVSAGSALLSLQAPRAQAEAAPRRVEEHGTAVVPPEVLFAVPTMPAESASTELGSGSINNLVAFTSPVSRPPTDARVYAGPKVRKLARELDVNLQEVKGSGPRGRIVPADVHGHVKSLLSVRVDPGAQSGAGLFALPPSPKVDYAKFGTIDRQPLSRIRKIAGANLHRNWISIPHVTNHDDADVTDLELFRAELNLKQEKQGVKISPLPFVMKACAAALQAFPRFNSSLDGETLILKRYCHIGFAADTPDGLVVPVVRDVDRKGIVQIALELAELAARARAGKLAITEVQGGTFSISSLGGIGGRYFTPIINAPEIAILGVGRTQTRPVWLEGQIQPRSYLPLSLSWDHRVVDGAEAACFNAHLTTVLADVRRLLL